MAGAAGGALALPWPGAKDETGRELRLRLSADELVDEPAAEEELLALVNQERERVGLAALALNAALSRWVNREARTSPSG